MPRGTDTYRGLGLPQEGNVNLKAVSTADVFTVTQSSGGGGNFLVLRDRSTAVGGNVADSTVQTANVMRVSSAGAIGIMSGTTILMELNTSGLYVRGSKQLFDSSGSVPQVSLGTTRTTLASSNTGKLHVVSADVGSTIFIMLPTSGNCRVGDYWDIFHNTSVAAQTNIVCNGANTGAQVFAHVGSTNAVATTVGVENESSGVMWVRVLCFSTTPSFAVSNQMNMSYQATTSFYNQLQAGATTA